MIERIIQVNLKLRGHFEAKGHVLEFIYEGAMTSEALLQLLKPDIHSRVAEATIEGKEEANVDDVVSEAAHGRIDPGYRSLSHQEKWLRVKDRQFKGFVFDIGGTIISGQGEDILGALKRVR